MFVAQPDKTQLSGAVTLTVFMVTLLLLLVPPLDPHGELIQTFMPLHSRFLPLRMSECVRSSHTIPVLW